MTVSPGLPREQLGTTGENWNVLGQGVGGGGNMRNWLVIRRYRFPRLNACHIPPCHDRNAAEKHRSILYPFVTEQNKFSVPSSTFPFCLLGDSTDVPPRSPQTRCTRFRTCIPSLWVLMACTYDLQRFAFTIGGQDMP